MNTNPNAISQNDFQNMKTNDSCTLAAIPLLSRNVINIYSIISDENFAIQYFINASDNLKGDLYNKFDFVSCGNKDYLIILDNDSILVYEVPLKREIGFEEIKNFKKINLSIVSEDAFSNVRPRCLRISKFGCELYFGFILGNYVVIDFLNLEDECNPTVLEVRRYHYKNGFVWFDFVKNDDIYLLTKSNLFRKRLLLDRNEFHKNDRLIKTYSDFSATKKDIEFKTANISPVNPSVVALNGTIKGFKNIFIFNNSHIAFTKINIEPISLQWSSYGSDLYVVGKAKQYKISNVYSDKLSISS